MQKDFSLMSMWEHGSLVTREGCSASLESICGLSEISLGKIGFSCLCIA